MSTGIVLILVGLWICGHAIWSDWPATILGAMTPG